MISTPQAIAEKGENIYKTKFQKEYEQKYPGKFVVIDITSEEALVADSPEKAIEAAQSKNPGGLFHLIKIGSSGVYRVGYTSGTPRDWVFR